MNLREQYLEALKASGKTMVSKSASGPQLYAVRNGAGEVLGFYPGEPVSPDEVKRVISKSALPKDPNGVFNDARLFPTYSEEAGLATGEELANELTDVQKSANLDANAELIGIFPDFLR